MRFGITLPQIGEHATKENVINLSKKAERQGFDSLWVLERLVSPLKPMNPYPGTKDGSLPTHFQNVLIHWNYLHLLQLTQRKSA
ncbi:MAG: hypothetical protein JO327_14045 [Nitrososphaeraceae archaeon]|nr:hypothetical protein [Nitrososphaeraceae archaeon]